ncbi:CoA-transferase family III [Vararia minispora EC-137]|uniref:CoA-transferase family III n=1 Tax=Vararia minispora EC-137 TaxID=1314806 RepID=A0ACB8QHQ1_9AGAM|nr:CoA-transferase family III [Vararia minispora EC-137]
MGSDNTEDSPSPMVDAMLRDMLAKPVRAVWTHHGLPPDDIERIVLGNAPDPSVNSAFKLGTAAQTAIGLSALAATHFHALRTGVEQTVRVDPRHAVIEFNSENYYTIDQKLPRPKSDDELTGMYEAKDGWVRLQANFPDEKRGLVELLQCEPTRASAAETLKQWGAYDFVDAVLERGLAGAALRSFSSIDAHWQGLSTRNISPVSISRIEDGPLRTFPPGKRPLEGVRVLDMTRVLAGPIAGRTLAAHGADVLLVSSPMHPPIPEWDVETSRGKRTTLLDTNAPEDRATLQELLKDADVFLHRHRPGVLEARGLGPKDLAKLRPGIVHANVSAFAHMSPYWHRNAFEEEVEMVGGYAVQEAETFKEWLEKNGRANEAAGLPPWRLMPMSALTHLAGQFLAFGITTALCKTMTEGGSWEVHVSLESVGLWLRHLGLLMAEEAHNESMPLPPRVYPLHPEVAALSVVIERDDGDNGGAAEVDGSTMTVVRHAAELEQTPVRYGSAPMRLDAHKSRWLPRGWAVISLL